MNKIPSSILAITIAFASCCNGVDTRIAAKSLDLKGPGRQISIAYQELAPLEFEAIETSREVGGALCIDRKYRVDFEENIDRKDIVLTTDKALILDSLQPSALPAGTNLFQHTEMFEIRVEDLEGSVRRGTFTIKVQPRTKPETYTFTILGKTSKGAIFSDTATVTFK